jgi:hypothetical protein
MYKLGSLNAQRYQYKFSDTKKKKKRFFGDPKSGAMRL